MTAIIDVPQTVIPHHSQRATGLAEQMNRNLFDIIRNNFNTQYATQAASLAEFRDAVSRRGGFEADAALLADFRTHVPLSNYDSYKPFIDKFNLQPCRQEDVENLLVPGLPDVIALSGATSGTRPKVLPRYKDATSLTPWKLDPNSKEPFAGLISTDCRDVKVIERAPGDIVQGIPVCCGSGGAFRRALGWYTDDESWMSLNLSGYAVPLAATVIRHVASFLIIHGLFFLSHKNVYGFFVPFATQFVDLMRHIDEHWELLVSCIKDGVLPDLEGINDVRGYLQAHFHPNPERAAELRDIGSPFSSDGWFSRVWPSAGLSTICSGPFATVVPKVRSILGPSVTLRNIAYASSEAMMGAQRDADNLDEFILCSDAMIEFLDVSLDATHDNLRQAWEVEVGKHYEPILTTRNGLWRYQLGDVLQIVGFDAQSQSPIFTVAGRRSLTIRLPHRLARISDKQLLSVIQDCSSEDGVRVHEFTAALDERTLVPTVGFFVELACPLGPNAHTTSQKLFDALVALNSEHQVAFSLGKIRRPTIRIVKAGTFAEYRRWKCDSANIPPSQIKVPLVLLDPRAQEWILGNVIQEL